MNFTKTIVTTLFLMISGVIAAQNTAADLMKSAVDKMKSYTSIEATFDYSMINKEAGIHETQSGTGIMKGNAYKLLFPGQELISDGTTMWTYMPDNEEVMVSDAPQDGSSFSPLMMLTTYDENYSMKFVNNNGTKAKTKTIEMTKKDNDLEKVVVVIDETEQQVSKISVFDENGNEFVIDIKDMCFDKTYPDDYFIFNSKDYPNVEVIDMR